MLVTLHSFSIYWHQKHKMGSKYIDGERKEEKIRPKKRELHELLVKWYNLGLLDSPHN